MKIVEFGDPDRLPLLDSSNVRGVEFDDPTEALQLAMKLNAYARRYDDPMYHAIDVSGQASTALALQQRILQELSAEHDGEIGSFGIPVRGSVVGRVIMNAVKVSDLEVELSKNILDLDRTLPELGLDQLFRRTDKSDKGYNNMFIEDKHKPGSLTGSHDSGLLDKIKMLNFKPEPPKTYGIGSLAEAGMLDVTTGRVFHPTNPVTEALIPFRSAMGIAMDDSGRPIDREIKKGTRYFDDFEPEFRDGRRFQRPSTTE